MTEPQSGQRRKLPVVGAAKHVLATVFNNLRPGFRLAAPWLAAEMLVNLWALRSLASTPESVDRLSFGLPEVISAIIGIIASASVAVSWHRFVLLNDDPYAVPHFRLDKPVWTYALTNVGIAFCFALPIGLLATAAESVNLVLLPFIIALVLLLLVFLIRFSLKLVAIALGHDKFTLAEAFELTRGNNSQILGVLAAVAFFFVIALAAHVLLVQLGNSVWPGHSAAFAVLIGLPVQFLIMMVAISMLTTLYGHLVEGRDF